MKRKKATQISTTVLFTYSQNNLILDLKHHYFSIIIDETTDVSTEKCLVVVSRYVKNNQICDRFLDLVQICDSTASGIFNVLQTMFQKFDIPMSNIVGLGADNCAVMMGQLNEVQALLKKNNPFIAILGCPCHSMHLCDSAAAEKFPRSVEQLSRDIYNYFQNSSKRLHELKECQIFY
ncbi:hypothetical protein RN001_003789 [Aquatica leii]|uniref:DUF4371 domain-containing protein n=1 Tax=Aquatica leii TaxID=1421715 RepID=A0AAN7SRQ2_9COLE|nr:hypothetical protein RN001_003789 [Aquatica leii]